MPDLSNLDDLVGRDIADVRTMMTKRGIPRVHVTRRGNTIIGEGAGSDDKRIQVICDDNGRVTEVVKHG